MAYCVEVSSYILVMLVICVLPTVEIGYNVALHKPVVQSGTLKYPGPGDIWRAETAVDGNKSCDSASPMYYSGTDNQRTPWWQVDLGRVFNISRVVVYGKQNPVHELQYDDFMLYATSRNDTSQAIDYATKTDKTNEAFDVVNGPMEGRFITIQLQALPYNAHPLLLCEVEVYAEVCQVGSFGDMCRRSCHCSDGKSCHDNTGRCQSPGCLAGWKGQSCEIPCEHGTFGLNCAQHCHCYNYARCTNVQGTCPDTQPRCAPGWQRQTCDHACEHGTFGLNCTEHCHCYRDANCTKDQGICPDIQPRCSPGWQGPSCDQACEHGTFGLNCTDLCHCYRDANCTNDQGICPDIMPRCSPGWQGPSCDQACEHGTFGLNCIDHCHCYRDANCTNDQGICPDIQPRCSPGWQGPSCDQVCNHGTFGIICQGRCHCQNDVNCNTDNGTCPDNGPRCSSGWQGSSCDKECNHGSFGLDCSQQCHCYNDANCTNDNGICPDVDPRCASGWQGQSCDQECKQGRFGLKCSKQCHCYNDFNCTKANGTCPVSHHRCAAGWQGPSCDREALQQTGNPTLPAAGGATGAIVVIAVVIGVIIFIKHRKRNENKYASSSTGCRKEVSQLQVLQPIRKEKSSNDQLNAGLTDEENEHAYYSFSPTKSEIKPCNIWYYIRKMQEDECKAFYKEFEDLPHGLKLPYTAAMVPENRPKHRYREMYAYDHSRVVLSITGPGQTDYINASHVHGFERTKKFIASQGPTDKMTNDFWRMIWQQKAETIVMLTNVMENGNKKCEKYWPDDDEVEAYGQLRVKVTRTDLFTDYYRRQMEVTMEGETARTVTQFHFRSWPDKDVPDSTWCLVNFWRAASRHPSSDAPIVVHCSAGIGRTGTYIALDYLYNQLQQEGSVRPFQAVHALRRQRVNMVQTREQYAYLHEAVADAIDLGTHFILASQFQEYYDYMTQPQPGASKSPLKIQFELAVQSQRETMVAGASAAALADETYANADVAAEINAYRPQIKKRNSNYIKEMGAMYLPIYSGAEGFLIAKSPTEKSIVEFWSLVHKQNVKTVISLCESTATAYRACANLGVDTVALDGLIKVTALNATKFRSFDERTYALNEHGKEDGSRATLKVFDYKAWKAGYNSPAETRSMLELLDAVTRWQPHFSEAQPILVNCNNGTRRSGLVCLILSELQRLKREDGQVNILDSLMQLKQRNMDVIENEGQYQYCFDLIKMYVQQSKEEPVQLQKNEDQHIYTNM